jgi:8-oxo-dGTP pyrophosphatase MutT (NUDIX family)
MAKIKPVDNESHDDNPVGRFMVAVGAVISNLEGKILLIKRSSQLDWHPGEWEIMYGRLAQHEDPQHGLAREVREEIGITIAVGRPLRAWHIYRGHEDTAENELIGLTFLATTASSKITLSAEHEDYRWVTPEDALNLIQVDGIKRDIQAFLDQSRVGR